MKQIKPPRKRSKEAENLRKSLLAEYKIDDPGGLAIIDTVLLPAFDSIRECEKILAKDGLVSCDRFGQRRAHPLCAVLRDARSGFLQAQKMLHLDLEPLRDIGRPGGE